MFDPSWLDPVPDLSGFTTLTRAAAPPDWEQLHWPGTGPPRLLVLPTDLAEVIDALDRVPPDAAIFAAPDPRANSPALIASAREGQSLPGSIMGLALLISVGDARRAIAARQLERGGSPLATNERVDAVRLAALAGEGPSQGEA